jgi:hypothetical protein
VSNQRDRRQVVSVPAKDAPHCQNTLPCCSIAGDTVDKAKSAKQSFVLDEPPRFEQVHPSPSLLTDNESFGLEEMLPFCWG